MRLGVGDLKALLEEHWTRKVEAYDDERALIDSPKLRRAGGVDVACDLYPAD